MEQEIKLQLLAKDFKYTLYLHNSDCAIAKAVKRTLNLENVRERGYITEIEGVSYHHDRYDTKTFMADKELAEEALASRMDDAIIREIVLTKRESVEETL